MAVTINNLKGKTVLITGASGDIGRACALAFGKKGANLVLHSFRNHSVINDIQKELSDVVVCPIKCDATDVKEVAKQFDLIKNHYNIKTIDVLVNNVGDLIERCPFDKMDWKLVQKSIDVNLKSGFLFTKFALPLIPNGGSIIFISSQTARWGKGDRSSHYGAAKAAVLGLMKCLANELGSKKIRVNSVAPGFIEGQFHKKYTSRDITTAHARKNPMGRNGNPDDVAGAVLFLGSPVSSYVNGTVIDVCGGDFIA